MSSSSSSNKFSIDETRKLFRISMYTSALIVEIRIVNFPSKITWQIICSRQAVIFIYFRWTTFDKSSGIVTLINADTWFLNEYHFHPNFHTPWLFFFCWLERCFILFVWSCWFYFGFSVCKSHFIEPISYSSVKRWYLFRRICLSFVSYYIFNFPDISLSCLSDVLVSFVVYRQVFPF